MKRRKFLETLAAVLGSTIFAFIAYPFVRFISPRKAQARSKKLVLKKSEIPAGDAIEVKFNDTPVLVLNRRGKGLIAFSRVCTHFGCLVHFDKSQAKIICPCHAGEFSLEGKVLAGPPPRPLDRVPLKVEGEKVFIG